MTRRTHKAKTAKQMAARRTQWVEWAQHPCTRELLRHLRRGMTEPALQFIDCANERSLHVLQGRARASREVINFLESKANQQFEQLCAAAEGE